jgi:hypothetical protein
VTLRRSPMKPRRSPLSRPRASAKRSRERIRKVGKVGLKNARALRVFKRECARLGIERCEVRYMGCTGEPTTWAHGRRRRFLKGDELERFAVAACIPCHTTLDQKMSHEECAREVARIIQLRPERYLEAA